MTALALLDFDPFLGLIEDSDGVLATWLVALALLLAIGIALSVQAHLARSPVERLIQKRAGRSL